MKRFWVRIAWLSLAALCVYAKDRDWKVGKILDSAKARSYVTTGVLDNGTVTSGAIDDQTIAIAGAEYLYTVSDRTVRAGGQPVGFAIGHAIANRHHGCRLIVNDSVKYSQEKAVMYVIDADGKECRMDIVRQERIEGK